MDAVSEFASREVPWDMLYADCCWRVICKSPGKVWEWQKALESKGLKVNVNKTETMICVKIEEPLHITDRNGKVLKQVEYFRYLG